MLFPIEKCVQGHANPPASPAGSWSSWGTWMCWGGEDEETSALTSGCTSGRRGAPVALSEPKERGECLQVLKEKC